MKAKGDSHYVREINSLIKMLGDFQGNFGPFL